MYIKLDDLEIPGNMILPETYAATPKNVYSTAKRSRGKSLKMIKVLLGTVYEIEFTINKMKIRNEAEFVSNLRKEIMQPEINVEFWDTYSNSYKTQSCYCQDTKFKARLIRGDSLSYGDIPLIFVANQAADWIGN